MEELGFRSATALCADLAAGTLSSVELLDHFRQRVERLNGRINAVIATDFDGARQRARNCDEAVARGERLGPLHGLPITIKDSFQAVGMPTTSGAPELADFRPTENAVAVQRLVDAGAVVFGKTNLPFMATGFESYNDLFGTSRNPWNPDRTCGGSGGGPAASVAAGLATFDISSDIGGSVRTPAHFCGVFAHKPSSGLVPHRGHIPGPPGTLAETDMVAVGPITRAAADLSLTFEVLAGPDVLEASGWQLALPAARHERLADFRIAAWLDDPVGPVDAEVLEKLDDAVVALERQGIAVDRAARPDFDVQQAFDAFLSVLASVLGAGQPDDGFAVLSKRANGLDPADRSVPATWRRGLVLSHRQWLGDNELRARIRFAWARFFRDFDVLLTPPMGTAAFSHDQGSDFADQVIAIGGEPRPYLEQLFWPGFANFAHLPASVVPLGQARSGLPVGMQIMAGHLEDRTALRFAELTEKIWGGYAPPPGFE